jgi:hemolysin III
VPCLWDICSAFTHQVSPSEGIVGELRRITNRPDGTGGVGTGGECGNPVRERAGELQVRAPVEVAEALEAELADTFRGELAPRRGDRKLDPLDQALDVARRDRALVGCPDQRRPQLGPVERLADAIALADIQTRPLEPLVGGVAAPTRRAFPAAADSGAVLGSATLENASLTCAARAIHDPDSTTRGGVKGFSKEPGTLHLVQPSGRAGAGRDPASNRARIRVPNRAQIRVSSCTAGVGYPREVMPGERDDRTPLDRAAQRVADARDAAADRVADARDAAAERVADAKETAGDFIARQKPQLRGVSHVYAFFVSLVLGSGLILAAEGLEARLAVAIYAVSLSAVFGVSALYHRVEWRRPQIRRRMRRLDHTMIFLLIAGTVTPFALLVMEGPLATGLLIAAWAGAAAGTIMELVWVDHPKWVGAVVYVAVGSIGAVGFPAIVVEVGIVAGILIAAGGALYVTGALVYAAQRPDPSPTVFGYHEIFHALVIAAAAAHFAAIALFALPAA